MSKKTEKKKELIDGVFRFLSPDEVDALIRSKIAQTAKHKGRSAHAKWTESEMQARDSVIIEYICHQGLSRAETAKQISDRWGIHLHTAERYIREAVEHLVRDYDEYTEEVRKVHLERLEKILQEALDRDNLDTALKVMDQISKVQGLYLERKEVTVNDIPISFKFGNEE